MTRYAAFLRGISPMNAKMPALKKAFESAGFGEVATVLSSGNVVFAARASTPARLERRAEAALHEHLGVTFLTLVRPIDELRRLLASDPYDDFDVPPRAKRIVTFLRAAPTPKPRLPIEIDGARILRIDGNEVLSAYVPSARGPVFMTLIEKTFGKLVTTRTWGTVERVVRLGS